MTRVVPAAHLVAETEALVQALATKPPVAVRLGKVAFAAATESSLPAGLEAMQAQLSLLTTTQDAAEGVRAFLEKRDPQWTGRRRHRPRQPLHAADLVTSDDGRGEAARTTLRAIDNLGGFSMRHMLSRTLAVLVCALLAVLVLPTAAGAAPPYEPVEHWADTEPVEFQLLECGLTIDVSGLGRGVFFAQPVKGSDGQAYYGHSVYSFTETWTTVDGSMTLVARGAFRESRARKIDGPVTYEQGVWDPETGEPVIDPDTGEQVTVTVTSDHVWEFTARDSGTWTWYDSSGNAVLRFSGAFITREQFDTFGDSQPGAYPIPGTFEVLRDKKSWPRGGEFCDVILANLG